MSFEQLGTILMIVVVIGFIAVRQLLWTPFVLVHMWRIPAIVGVAGIYLLSQSSANTTISPTDVAFLASELLLALITGAIMGFVTHTRPIPDNDTDLPGRAESSTASPSFGGFGSQNRGWGPRAGTQGTEATLETRAGWGGVALWLVLVGARLGIGAIASTHGDTIGTSTGVILLVIAANRIASVAVLTRRTYAYRRS